MPIQKYTLWLEYMRNLMVQHPADVLLDVFVSDFNCGTTFHELHLERFRLGEENLYSRRHTESQGGKGRIRIQVQVEGPTSDIPESSCSSVVDIVRHM